MACEYCDIIQRKNKAVKIYEDDKIVAILCDKPSALGHILLMPKEHYPIIEQVPDYIISQMFIVANKLCVSAFEGMNAMGTNILVNNGVTAGQSRAHFMIHIIPRKEGDNIGLSWQPKAVSPDELATNELKIKEQAKGIGEFEKEKPKPIIAEDPIKITDQDLMIKVLDRIP